MCQILAKTSQCDFQKIVVPIVSQKKSLLLLKFYLCMWRAQKHKEDYYLPVWTLSCLFNLALVANLLPQRLHAKCFSPLWLILCSFARVLSVNVSPQISQVKGFSSVWTLSCLLTWDSCLNVSSQKLHLNGFSPRWEQFSLKKKSIQGTRPQKYSVIWVKDHVALGATLSFSIDEFKTFCREGNNITHFECEFLQKFVG